MKRIISKFMIIFIAAAIMSSCERISGSGIDSWYYIYITGDEGKVLQISYLQENHPSNYQGDNSPGNEPVEPSDTKQSDKDIVVSQTVTLPFFKEVHTVGTTSNPFLEIVSENDSTTRSVIFDNSLSVRRADGQECWSVVGNLTGRSEYSVENCDECTSCKGLTRDSILNYIKESDYPCYIEFSKVDTRKKVSLYDW
jgi:hypothetical protein